MAELFFLVSPFPRVCRCSLENSQPTSDLWGFQYWQPCLVMAPQGDHLLFPGSTLSAYPHFGQATFHFRPGYTPDVALLSCFAEVLTPSTFSCATEALIPVQLLKIVLFLSPLLVSKGIYHYWRFVLKQFPLLVLKRNYRCWT